MLVSCGKEKDRICEVYEAENGYVIGTIESYVSGLNSVTYHYSYSVDGTNFEGEEKASLWFISKVLVVKVILI